MTSHSPNLICINKITSFLLFISTSIAFLIHLLKTVDFEKSLYNLQMKMEIYWLFKINRKLNIQNGGLHWLNRCQNFDFQIVLPFLFYIRFWSCLWQIAWFNIMACMGDSHAYKVAVPFKPFCFLKKAIILLKVVASLNSLSPINKMSGLIWIQTVWHSDGISERIFQKS